MTPSTEGSRPKDKVLRDRIRTFLEETSETTGLQFLELPYPPSDDDTRWVFFINRRGLLPCADCTIANFTNRGVQKIVLGYDCLASGGGEALAPTVLALAGVPPQHNAPNRDYYISVLTENVIPEKKELFKVLPKEDWLFDDIDYDFSSAGHYDFHKYTKNGLMTIRPVRKADFPVGEATELSPYDIIKIKMLYGDIYKPVQSQECSRLFKPGKKIEDDTSNNEVTNDSSDSEIKLFLHKSKKSKYKRGLKKFVENGMDFDTDLDT